MQDFTVSLDPDQPGLEAHTAGRRSVISLVLFDCDAFFHPLRRFWAFASLAMIRKLHQQMVQYECQDSFIFTEFSRASSPFEVVPSAVFVLKL